MPRSLVALAALALALSGLSSQAVAGNPGVMKMIPPGTVGLIQIDMKGIRGSMLYRELHKILANGPQYQNAKKEAEDKFGFDFEKDLDGFTAAINSKGNGIVVVSGKFDQAKIAAVAKKDGAATKKKHKGVEYWHGKDDSGVAFIGGQAIVGKISDVKAAIEAHKGKRLKSSAPVMKLAKKVDQKKHIWVAAEVTDDMRRQMPGLNSVHGQLDLSKGIAMRFEMAFADKKQAAALVAKIHEGVKKSSADPGMAMMGVAKLMARLQAKAEGKSVLVSGDWSDAELVPLTKMAGMFIGMAAAQQKAPPQPPMKMAPPPTPPQK